MAATLNTQLGGGKLSDYGGPIPGPCEKDTVDQPSRTFNLTGSYDTTMPQQFAALDHLRDQWQRDGWQIDNSTATAASGDRQLTGLDPTNHYDLTIGTDRKKGFLDITIVTPCYRYPTTTSVNQERFAIEVAAPRRQS